MGCAGLRERPLEHAEALGWTVVSLKDVWGQVIGDILVPAIGIAIGPV